MQVPVGWLPRPAVTSTQVPACLVTNLPTDRPTDHPAQALIVGVGSLAASTPYLAIILATIIGAWMTAPSADADLSPHPETLTQTP